MNWDFLEVLPQRYEMAQKYSLQLLPLRWRCPPKIVAWMFHVDLAYFKNKNSRASRIRGLNGKSYPKTLRGLFVALLEAIRAGHFFLKIFINVAARGLQTCQKHDDLLDFDALYRPNGYQ